MLEKFFNQILLLLINSLFKSQPNFDEKFFHSNEFFTIEREGKVVHFLFLIVLRHSVRVYANEKK